MDDSGGADARIVLDAYSHVAIPAKVSFIASQAHFTPKIVETQDERDKLMLRIRVRVVLDRLRGRADTVRSGLPGVAYVLTVYRGVCTDRWTRRFAACLTFTFSPSIKP